MLYEVATPVGGGKKLEACLVSVTAFAARFRVTDVQRSPKESRW